MRNCIMYKRIMSLICLQKNIQVLGGDLELLLCGPWGRQKRKKLKYLDRPLVLFAARRKKNDHFLPNIFKVENDPQALGRILVDY